MSQMNASHEIRHELDLWEGNVLTCYRDPVGIPTIGKGFTAASAVLRKHIPKLIPGKTKITAAQSDAIFAEMLDKEYEPMVDMPSAKQHEFDVGVSLVWNLGPKSMKWKWAQWWRQGKKTAAANHLSKNYNTARGKKLPGLVRRRREEAQILRTGKYPNSGSLLTPSTPPPGVQRDSVPEPRQPDEQVREVQEFLMSRGYNLGKSGADGWYGEYTKAAVLAYQKTHPHLVNDGILGRATYAQIERDQVAKSVASKTAVGGGAAITVGGIANTVESAVRDGIEKIDIQSVVMGSGIPYAPAAAILVAIVAGYFVWQYRDVIEQYLNQWRGKVVHV